MKVLYLTWKSIQNRLFSTTLTIAAVAISVTLLLGIDRIHKGAQDTFESTISGTDLIVGARSSPVQLLLYSVFRIGGPTNNMSWESYEEISADEEVEWTIPISLGDSHRNYPVIGTNRDYFSNFRFRGNRHLEFSEGRAFEELFEVVIGYEVANKLQYEIGKKLTLSHGTHDVSFQKHDNFPFNIVGILRPTGTPVDKSLHISLEAMEALHHGWDGGFSSQKLTPDKINADDLKPKAITAFLVGLKSKLGIFQLQRMINDYESEPLTAVLPAVAFAELWSLVSVIESALQLISYFVVIVCFAGMLNAIISTLELRRREMSILRAIGARPKDIFLLFVSEALLLTSLGCIIGLTFLYASLFVIAPVLEKFSGIMIPISGLSQFDIITISILISCSFFVGLFPAYKAYKNSLADGLAIKI